MKREEITAIFPEATKEQLDQIMMINGADIQHAKSGFDDLKAQLDKANADIKDLKVDADEFKRLQGVETELTELKNENQIRDMRDKVSKETGVPVYLLTGDTEEDCTKYAKALKEYAKPSKYPEVPNGGEPDGGGGAQTTAEQFAEWSEQIF